MPTVLKRELDPKIQALLQRQGLKDLAALSRKIGRYEQRMTVYRVLLNDNKHESLRLHRLMAQALTVDTDNPVTLEKLAKCFLDLSKGQCINSIEKLMAAAGIPSRYELSRRMGVDNTTVYSIFDKDHQHIQLKVYRDISRGLGCVLDELSEILLTRNDLSTYGRVVTISPVTKESISLIPRVAGILKCILSNRARRRFHADLRTVSA